MRYKSSFQAKTKNTKQVAWMQKCLTRRHLAGDERIELPTYGFGDRRSTNWANLLSSAKTPNFWLWTAVQFKKYSSNRFTQVFIRNFYHEMRKSNECFSTAELRLAILLYYMCYFKSSVLHQFLANFTPAPLSATLPRCRRAWWDTYLARAN